MKPIKYVMLTVLLLLIVISSVIVMRNAKESLQEAQTDVSQEAETQVQPDEDEKTVINLHQELFDAPDVETRKNVERDAEEIVLDKVAFRVIERKRIQSPSDVKNEKLRENLMAFTDMQDDAEYIMLTVAIENRNGRPVSLYGNALSPIIVGENDRIEMYFEPMIFEEEDSKLEIAPNTECKFSMIALELLEAEEYERLIQEGEWYLCLNFCGQEIDMSNKQIFFLRVGNDQAEE